MFEHVDYGGAATVLKVQLLRQLGPMSYRGSTLAVAANLSSMTASSMLSSIVFSDEIRIKSSNLSEVMLDLTVDLTMSTLL